MDAAPQLVQQVVPCSVHLEVRVTPRPDAGGGLPEPVDSRREFYTELWKHRPGEPVLLSLLRGGTPKAIEVVAGDRAEFYR